MSQIAVRLSESELKALDTLVDRGRFGTRAAAVRAGIRLLERQSRDFRIAASYQRVYAEPLADDETQMLEAAAALAGDALK